MRKTLVLILLLMLPLAWVWSAGEDAKSDIDNEGVAITPVKDGNLLDSSNPIPDPPLILTNILSQDFEEVWDPGTPPTGWTIIDNGTEGSQCWYLQDWYKEYYAGWADTVARFQRSAEMEITYDEWLISPDVALSGIATACSLTFRTWYRDQSVADTADTAYIKISADGGAHWTTLETWGATTANPALVNIDLTAYAGQTVRVAFNLKTYGTYYRDANTWVIDKVGIWEDASSLLFEDFNNWGLLGDNPPTNWTILDNGTPKPAEGVWNVNDYHKYSYWGDNDVARVYYSYYYQEWLDEWMISPSFSIPSSGNPCSLHVDEYYNRVTTVPPLGYEDHGYIKITTDGGAHWNIVYDNDATKGSSSTPTNFAYDLTSYAGNTCQIAFHFVNAPYSADEWAFDNVSVDEYAPVMEDVEVTSIDAPPALITSGGNYTITATLTQLMADSTLIDSIEFKVEDSTPAVVFSNTIYPAVYILGFSSRQFSSSAQWNPLTDGPYAITVTMYAATDVNPVNDAYVSAHVVQSLLSYPFEEDFEGGLVTSVYDWVGLADGFEFRTGAGDAHSPDTALYFNYTTFPKERIAVSPPIYVSGSTDPLLRFWEKSSHADGPRNDETHTVGLVAGDWDFANLDTLFWEDSSSALIDEYRESNVSAGAIEGDTVRIVLWYHLSQLAAGWYVDDISLGDTPYGDVGPIDFVSGTNGFVNQAYSPVVEVANYGFDTPDVPVKLVIDSLGTVVYTEYDTITAIPANSTANATFADFTPLESGIGIYTMTATTELVTVLLDNNPANDTLTAGLMVYDALVDLEADNGGLRGSGDWQWGAPTSGPNSAYSGANVWATNLSGNYAQGLHTLEFRIDVGTTSPTFGFASWYITDGDFFAYDGCNFAVSTDNGTTWTVVSPDRGYDKIAEYTNPLYPDSVFAGTGQQFWEQISFDLTAYAGTVVKARLALGATYNLYDGWYVDDFAFLDCSLFFPADDIAVISIDEPTGLYIFTDYSIDPQGTVENVGTTAQTFDAIMIIENLSMETVVYGDTVSVVDLAPGATQQAAFDSWTVPALPGETYVFNFLIENQDDYDPSNNLVKSNFESAIHYAEGGPDSYGYEWFDNLSLDPALAPTFSWIELTTSPTADTIGTGAGTLGNFALGFTFPFYGNFYDSVYVNAFGYLTFGGTYNSASNDCPLPDPGSPYNPLIAGFWDNGYPQSYYDGATIMETFGTSPDMYTVIQYHNHHAETPAVYTIEWEIILHENGDIVLQYADVDEDSPYGLGQSATTGIESDTITTRSGLTYHCVKPPTYSCNDPGNLMFDGLAVRFHVRVPGTVAGTVTDANDASPIAGAVVTATSLMNPIIVTDTTDFGGNYSIDIISGTVNVTVEAYEYVTDSRDVAVVNGQTTTHNVALTAPVTTIDTSPIIDTVDVGDTALYARYLYNTGTAPLEYLVTLGFDDGGLLRLNLGRTGHPRGNEIFLDDTWISVASGDSGTVAPDDSVEIVFLVDFRDSTIVADSTYQAIANILDNAPGFQQFIPFSITAILASCDYIVGDVNGSDSYNGLDITYGVSYFKGGGEPMCPFGSCPIPPCDVFFYCGDVNASCSYNGLDITYGVNYFKGGPGPLPCGDCPPIELSLAREGKDFKPAVQPAVESK